MTTSEGEYQSYCDPQDEQDFMKLALEAIENEDEVCFDVAANVGQMFDNVKHMRWFAEAVADELENG